MPWLEIVLLVCTLLYAVLMLAGAAGGALRKGAATLLLLVLALTLAVVGPHWQMSPAYVAAIVAVAGAFTARRWLRVTLAVGTIALAATGLAFSIYLPIFRLPEPTGSYAIGTQIIPLVNAHPMADGAAGADGKRELVIQIWYPAAPSHAKVAPYRILKETTLLSSYQSVVPTHARWNAPFAAPGAPFPVLLLNPAWNGRRTYYMYLVEDLVSHGYVVAGIDHTGNSGPTAFPDGHVGQPLPDPGLDFDTHSYEEVNAYGARAQKIQVEDDRFVLDQLTAWNEQAGNFYQGRLDLDRVAAFGHSFGGSVAAELCREDSRVKAALDMDGSFWRPVQENGVATPLMMIEEDYAQYSAEDLKTNHADAIDYAFDQSDDRTMARSNGYRAVLHGSTHVSFTDRSLFSPFKSQSGIGTIPALREYAILRGYALAFFDKTLKGVDSPLLSPENKSIPEATFTILHRPAALDEPQTTH